MTEVQKSAAKPETLETYVNKGDHCNNFRSVV
jgi:hypothetical protein